SAPPERRVAVGKHGQEPRKARVEPHVRPEAPAPVAAAPATPPVPAARAGREATRTVVGAHGREAPVHGSVRGGAGGGKPKMRRGVMASAPGEVPARDACVMAAAAATRHVSAAEELAAAGVATPDVAAAMPATPEMAAPSEVTTAASGMAVRKRGDRRAGYGHPEQQGCPDPNPSRI